MDRKSRPVLRLRLTAVWGVAVGHACVMLLASVASAQSSYTTVPQGYLDREGVYDGDPFGWYASMRCQAVDREPRNLGAALFKELACRLDGGRAAASDAFSGRTWRNVSLRLSTPPSGAYATFSTNLSNDVRIVFSSSVTWPSRTSGPPTSLPHTWGTEVRFPLTTSWAYPGGTGITADFTFSGGTLANQTPWSGSVAARYYLDGVDSWAENGSDRKIVGDDGNPYCRRNGWTSTFAWTLFAGAKNHPNASYRDKIFGSGWLLGYPTNCPGIYGLALGKTTTGIPIGARCQPYYLGPNLVFVWPFVTPHTNSSPIGLGGVQAPYQQQAIGLEVSAQAAFVSSAGAELTRASWTTVPVQPQVITQTWFTYATDENATTGSVPSLGAPVLRIAY